MESFISWFETRMKISEFEINHTVNDSMHNYIIKHDLGYNWSLYHKTVLELIFNDVFERKINFNINDRMMEISFEK